MEIKMKRKIISSALAAVTITYALFASPVSSTVCLAAEEPEAVAAASDVKVSSRIFELLFGKREKEEKEVYLIPGGEVFGAKIKQSGVTVTDVADGITPLCIGDRIYSINGEEISSCEEARRLIDECDGKEIEVRVMRGGERVTLRITPRSSGGGYKLGVALKDGAAGIGTVTFINPEDKSFGGLGHGICDAETGEIIELAEGRVTSVILGGVERGECGKPGELRGVLTGKVKGHLYSNNECGVFGVLDNIESTANPIPVGRKSDLHTGKANIISTVKGSLTASYSIEITDIDYASDGTKSFSIKVTDPDLIALTGGIVRGMSGSPIIQDGKLVGAVTHVLVADPTEGYGIFIENMLNAAKSEALPKAA